MTSQFDRQLLLLVIADATSNVIGHGMCLCNDAPQPMCINPDAGSRSGKGSVVDRFSIDLVGNVPDQKVLIAWGLAK